MGRRKGSKNKKTKLVSVITQRKTKLSIAPIPLANCESFFCMQFNEQTNSELCNAKASNKNLHYDFRIRENKICNRCITDNQHIKIEEIING